MVCFATAACGGGKASPDGAGSGADTGVGGTVAVDGGTVACLANTMVLAGDLYGQRIDAQATGPSVVIQHVNGEDTFDLLAPFNDWQMHLEWNTQFTAGYPPGVGWGGIKLPFESSAHAGESFCVTDGRLTEVDLSSSGGSNVNYVFTLTGFAPGSSCAFITPSVTGTISGCVPKQ